MYLNVLVVGNVEEKWNAWMSLGYLTQKKSEMRERIMLFMT